MNKDTYLSTPAVNGFVNYLRTIIIDGDGTLSQQYRERSGRGRLINITSFQDAIPQYQFGSKNFEQTEVELVELSERIKTAASNRENEASAELELLTACLDTLIWGGVTNSATVSWLSNKARTRKLSECLISGARALTSDDDDLSAFDNPDFVRSDSAATKIFALIDRNSIIYDNRVGAAIGKLIVSYLERIDAQKTPDVLKFMTKSGQRRNPRTSDYHFETKMSGRKHAIWNQRANWIIGALANEPAVRDAMNATQVTSCCRLIETALFMIGGDIRGLSVNVTTSSPDIPLTNEVTPNLLPAILAGRVVEGSQTVTSHNFTRVINLYKAFRNQYPECHELPPFKDRLQNAEHYRKGAAEAYCYPLRNGEFGLKNSSDELITHLAEQPLSQRSLQWLIEMSLREQLPRTLVACYTVVALSEINVDNRHDRLAAVVERGLVGGPGAASIFLSVGTSFGKHFGLLGDNNEPTDRFYMLFPANGNRMPDPI